MQKKELERKVAEFAEIQPWNHNFMLPHGVETSPGQQSSHGKNLVKFERLRPLFDKIDLAGKRVLDVGCNEGFFSFQMADMKAQVLGIDVDEHRIAKARFIQSVLHVNGVEFDNLDIYSEGFRQLPTFDLCLCLGFLHRVPDPYSAISALAAKTNMIVFEWKALKFGPHDNAFAYFSPKDVDQQDFYGTEYWLLSYATVERIMRRLGFGYFHRVDDPRQRRAILIAGRYEHPVFSQPDVILHRGRIKALLSHTKSYAKTVVGIITGRVNA